MRAQCDRRAARACSVLTAVRRAAGAALVAVLCAALAAAQASAPGAPLLAAIERAPLIVVGRVTDIVPLDASAYGAQLRVARGLRGPIKAGDSLSVAWEEPGRPQTPRLNAGQDVLIALEDPPSQSLWRRRMQARPTLHVIAADGNAFWPAPAAPDLKALAGYVALPADAPASQRASALVTLAGLGSDTLATAAIARMAAQPDLAAQLAAKDVERLLRLAMEPHRPQGVRRAIIEIAASARWKAAIGPLQRIPRSDPLAALALQALGQLDALPPDQVEALLNDQRADLRAVGARYATGALAERRLPTLARADASPQVRAAAVAGLAATRTIWGVDGCMPALADADPTVRNAAVTGLGRLGAPAVPALEDVARTSPPRAAGAMAALALAGPPGDAALRRLMQNGPNEQVRALARLALGQGPGEH